MVRVTLKASPDGLQKAKAALRRFASKMVLADLAGLSRTTVQAFFAGKEISVESFRQICETLELSWDAIASIETEALSISPTRAEQPPENKSDPAIATPNLIPISSNPEFIGSALFDLLGRDPDRQKLSQLSQKHKLVLLKAGAGIGKSTLARHFLETQFTKVIRLEMGLESGNVTPAEEKVSQILRKEFDEEPSRDFQTNLEILREKLSDKLRPIGVLIDNLEPALDANFRFLEKLRGYEDLLRILGDRDVCSFTLITSRRSLIGQRVKLHEYSLQGLDIEAWREYFHDCENGATSESLEQMCVTYNGNAKVMDILHGAITNRFDGNIAAYWNRYKDALLADAELETLISMEMDWLRDNQRDAYKLLCRMGCYRYQDVKTVPFKGLICLLWDVPESRQTWIVDYLSKISLIEVRGEYYLHPAIREAAKLRMRENLGDWYKANFEAAKYWESTILDHEFLENRLNIFEAFYHFCTAQEYEDAFFVLSRKTSQYNYEKNRYIYLRFWGYSSQVANCLNAILDKLTYTSRIHAIGAIAVCYYYNSEYRLSIDYMKQAKNCINSREDYIYQRLLAECLFYLSRSHCYLGRFKEAISFCEEALNYIRIINPLEELKIKGSKYSTTEGSQYFFETCKSSTFQSLSTIYYQMGEYNQCVVASIKAIESLEGCTTTVYREHGDALATNSLALYAQNKLNEAILIMLEAIYNFQKINDYLSEAYARSYLIEFYLIVNLRESQNQISKVESICNQYCKTLNLKARLHGSKALFFRQKFIIEIEPQYLYEAVNNHLECIKILKEIEVKPELAEEYFQLGLTYQANGEHDQAETYKVKALKLFGQMEAPKQIERVNQAFEQGAKK